MRLLTSVLRALSRRPARRRAAPQARPGVESLESRETPSGGFGGGGGGGGVIPVYYLPPGSVVPVQTAPPSVPHGHGGADVPQIKT